VVEITQLNHDFEHLCRCADAVRSWSFSIRSLPFKKERMNPRAVYTTNATGAEGEKNHEHEELRAKS